MTTTLVQNDIAEFLCALEHLPPSSVILEIVQKAGTGSGVYIPKCCQEQGTILIASMHRKDDLRDSTKDDIPPRHPASKNERSVSSAKSASARPSGDSDKKLSVFDIDNIDASQDSPRTPSSSASMKSTRARKPGLSSLKRAGRRPKKVGLRRQHGLSPSS